MARGKQQSRRKRTDVSKRDVDRTQVKQVLEELLEEQGTYFAEVVQRSFSGPLPPPDLLHHYDEIVPGLAERIVRMAEKEQDHRHSFEIGILRIFGRGQIFGFVLGVTALVLGTYLVVIGQDIYGVGMMISAIAMLAGSFFFGKRRRKDGEKNEKK